MKITVQELIDHLSVFPKDSEVIFGDDALTFYRTKSRGEQVQIEFNESVCKDDQGEIIVQMSL